MSVYRLAVRSEGISDEIATVSAHAFGFTPRMLKKKLLSSDQSNEALLNSQKRSLQSNVCLSSIAQMIKRTELFNKNAVPVIFATFR